MLLGDAAGDGERVVEVAAYLQHAGAVGDGLGQLAPGDATLRDEHESVEAAVRCVGGRGGARVACRSAEDSPRLGFRRLGHGNDHSPVLERGRWVAHLELEVQVLAADALDQPARPHERRTALAQAEHRRVVGDGQAVPVAFEDASGG